MTEAKKAEPMKKVQVRYFTKSKGDGETETSYACGGFHVAEEHRELLPRIEKENRRGKVIKKMARKIEPGKVYTLPESVAVYYLKNGKGMLEEVYD